MRRSLLAILLVSIALLAGCGASGSPEPRNPCTEPAPLGMLDAVWDETSWDQSCWS